MLCNINLQCNIEVIIISQTYYCIDDVTEEEHKSANTEVNIVNR